MSKTTKLLIDSFHIKGKSVSSLVCTSRGTRAQWAILEREGLVEMDKTGYAIAFTCYLTDKGRAVVEAAIKEAT